MKLSLLSLFVLMGASQFAKAESCDTAVIDALKKVPVLTQDILDIASNGSCTETRNKIAPGKWSVSIEVDYLDEQSGKSCSITLTGERRLVMSSHKNPKSQHQQKTARIAYVMSSSDKPVCN